VCVCVFTRASDELDSSEERDPMGLIIQKWKKRYCERLIFNNNIYNLLFSFLRERREREI